MARALLFIQKTIQVTSATAKIEVIPANNSSPRVERLAEVKLRRAPNPRASAAAAATPLQIDVRAF
jgi:hypothetical protein